MKDTRASKTPEQKGHTIAIHVSEAGFEMIQKAKEDARAKDWSALVAQALAVYELLMRETREGAEVLILRADESVKKLNLRQEEGDERGNQD